jgi:prepilin-type N-terminal cleavage/methylation domain-containing protein
MTRLRPNAVQCPHFRVFRCRAYTLLEVMIAISLFALVVSAIYACWSAVLRGSRGGLDAAAEVQRGRVAQRAIEEALTTAQLVTENLQWYSFIGETVGDVGYLSFVARLPLSFPGSGIFGDQVLRRVTFSIEPGKDSSQNLLLTQMPYLMAETADQEPYTIVLAKNVSLFALQFWSTNGNVIAGQGEWLDAWPFTNRLPNKIRYALAFDQGRKQSGAAPYVINSVAHLPSVGVGDRLPAGSAQGQPTAPVGPGGVPGQGGTRPGGLRGTRSPGSGGVGGTGFSNP